MSTILWKRSTHPGSFLGDTSGEETCRISRDVDFAKTIPKGPSFAEFQRMRELLCVLVTNPAEFSSRTLHTPKGVDYNSLQHVVELEHPRHPRIAHPCSSHSTPDPHRSSFLEVGPTVSVRESSSTTAAATAPSPSATRALRPS